MKKKLLFVDDDPNIIMGLKRMLRNMAVEWEMAFANSGSEALEILKTSSFDIVISDMQMPGMNGSELLTGVMNKYPQTVRLILSGHSDYELILKALEPTHQFLSKPCNPDDLKNVINSILKYIEVLTNEQLKELVLGNKQLFCSSGLFKQLEEEFHQSVPSTKKIAEIINQDIAMSVTVFKLVSSSFFSVSSKVASIEEAINILGPDLLKEIFIHKSIIAPWPTEFPIPEAILISLNNHSRILSNLVKEITAMEAKDRISVDKLLTVGLLHDVGMLLLIQHPGLYNKIAQYATEKRCAFFQAEYDLLGISHAELGACLLCLWGVPDSIVQTIYYHHRPSASGSFEFDILTPLHIAEALLSEEIPDKARNILDNSYLHDLKLNTQFSDWLNLVNNCCDKGGR